MNTHFFRTSLAGLAAICLAGVAMTASAAERPVPPDQVPEYWVLTGAPSHVNVPNTGYNLEAPGCASASYTIGSDGKTYNVKLRKVVPKSDLGPTVVQAVEQFRYRPSNNNTARRPIHTYYTAQFNMRDFSDQKKAKLTAACALPGFGSGD